MLGGTASQSWWPAGLIPPTALPTRRVGPQLFPWRVGRTSDEEQPLEELSLRQGVHRPIHVLRLPTEAEKCSCPWSVALEARGARLLEAPTVGGRSRVLPGTTGADHTPGVVAGGRSQAVQLVGTGADHTVAGGEVEDSKGGAIRVVGLRQKEGRNIVSQRGARSWGRGTG